MIEESGTLAWLHRFLMVRHRTLFTEKQGTSSLFVTNKRHKMKNMSTVPVARLFGPVTFEASKWKVIILRSLQLRDVLVGCILMSYALF
ncbi:hypothetical protein IGI04_040504 [Brassica rapa subsp. trilocularis]|uniref:Uncharacterized protein n=2 Tax=Brassica campestris TaxID=3711 RepID=A0A8D9I1J5_BRACM|nr:hypothetical protein IGI04_040504 [Brassica rapa subsp. trilocularis]CAG7909440.1 unnamed protein product [Brassica rapa]